MSAVFACNKRAEKYVYPILPLTVPAPYLVDLCAVAVMPLMAKRPSPHERCQ